MKAIPENEDVFVRAKRYSSIKYCLSIIDTLYLLTFLLIFTSSGASKILAGQITKFVNGRFFCIAAYFLAVYILYWLLDFPLSFYRSYIVEHKFCLSSQRIGGWLKDQLKSGIIAYLIGLLMLEAFYYLLMRYPNFWWLAVSILWIFFSLIFAKLVPILIIPLFFKYKRVYDDTLREGVINLAKKMGVRVLDVFEIDFSKKTKKANAAFVGLGRTKRVILTDTLREKYSNDEIEVILAHEFSHYKLRHLLKLILINSAVMILFFYVISKTSGYALSFFKFSSLSDIASLPIIVIYLIVFSIITQPLQNYISRRFEENADTMAIKESGLKGAFISMMEKLSYQNLSDRNPHPLIKFFFFDHPPVDERIENAERL